MIRSAKPRSWQRDLVHENSRFLQVSGLRVKYTGPGDSDVHAACIRTCEPAVGALLYFEVKVLNQGRDGFIGIGFVEASFDAGRLPGWEPHTFGYHGDDGKAFHNCTSGWLYGPTFGTGDCIGVLLNRAERTIAYTKNGVALGLAFTNVQEEVLYPAVGLRTPDEEIIANFGATPFKGDLEAMKSAAVRHLGLQILRTPLPCDRGGGSTGLVGRLLFSHLVLHGHWGAAAAVSRDLLGGSAAVPPVDVADFALRAHVRASIAAGDMDGALQHAEAYLPGGLASASPALLFRLQCQKLVELVRVRDDSAALAHGKAELGVVPATAEQQDMLADALMLLCYHDPFGSPQGALMSPAARTALADDVDAALLAARQRPQQSALERLYCCLMVLQDELARVQHPAAELVDFQQLLKGSADHH